MIKKATNFTNKRVLDLGANMGLCSIFIKKYTPARSVHSLECSLTSVEQIKKLSEIFHVQVPVFHLNLDSDPYEKVAGTQYDTAIFI